MRSCNIGILKLLLQTSCICILAHSFISISVLLYALSFERHQGEASRLVPLHHQSQAITNHQSYFCMLPAILLDDLDGSNPIAMVHAIVEVRNDTSPHLLLSPIPHHR